MKTMTTRKSTFSSQASEFLGVAALQRLWAEYADQRARREAIEQLGKLEDRDLADIGLKRCEIERRVVGR